jgi:hypothetical protein
LFKCEFQSATRPSGRLERLSGFHGFEYRIRRERFDFGPDYLAHNDSGRNVPSGNQSDRQRDSNIYRNNNRQLCRLFFAGGKRRSKPNKLHQNADRCRHGRSGCEWLASDRRDRDFYDD